jgi:hypothetical protein
MTAAPTDDPKVVKMNRQKAKRGTSWKDNLSLNDKGTPKACLANAICNALQSSVGSCPHSVRLSAGSNPN